MLLKSMNMDVSVVGTSIERIKGDFYTEIIKKMKQLLVKFRSFS